MLNEDIYKLSTYNYILPKELIAQYPVKNRDESRLLYYKKETNEITHHIFNELPEFLTEHDVLILNNTKVIPARFYCNTDKNKTVEILLVSSVSPDSLTWKVLAKPLKHLKKGEVICHSRASGNPDKDDQWKQRLDSHFHGNDILIEVINNETIRFKSYKDLEFILKNIGEMPLPPYIKRESNETDFERYQTVFAKEPGAVAAPTAALHFSEGVLKKLKNKGVEVLYITLHVGPGTFLPVRTDDIREHKLIPENFYIEKETWDKITEAKNKGKRIIACGTTTTRALEYAYRIKKLGGLTNLFIKPGFEFKIVNALITNFHLPKTTLLILISAFIGWDNVKKIYNEAIEQKYRFFSYGDTMFLY